MRNMLRIVSDDLRRLFMNTMSIVITVGLVVLPSLFAWYNILACWDVFDNTGNLRVAVANTDEGYESDLVPLRVNVGEQMVSALRANDQIDWVFTDEQDAVDGAYAGRYYAAVVIPPSFSRDMLTFYADDASPAKIMYYSNEKKNAIAPKVTDQGADAISREVNETFAETLSEVALGIAESLSRSVDSSDANSAIAAVSAHMDTAANRLNEVADLLDTYAALVQSSRGFVDSSAALVSSLQQQIDVAGSAVGAGVAAAGDANSGLMQTVDNLLGSLERAEQGLRDAADRLGGVAVGGVVDDGGAGAGEGDQDDASAGFQEGASSADQSTDQGSEGVLEGDSETDGADADGFETGESIGALQTLRDRAIERALAAADSLAALRGDIEQNVRTPLEGLAGSASSFGDRLSSAAAALSDIGVRLGNIASSAQGALGGIESNVSSAAADVRASAAQLKSLAVSINEALATGDADEVRSVLSADVQTLSRAIAAPVGVDRIAVYPVENFGSAMTPLYATLALFIGSLLIMVAMKPSVPQSEIDRLNRPKPRELFLGRFGVVGVVSLLQTTLMGFGCMLFLHVQVVHPLLFMVCFWVPGLVFSFVIYALVVAFANLGKAVAVLLLIVQVTGCGGSYPLAILPSFVQAVSPYLPATHVVNAMRAAMMGVYGNDFWVSIALTLAFVIPAAIIGLVARRPLARLMQWFVEHAESSKLIG